MSALDTALVSAVETGGDVGNDTSEVVESTGTDTNVETGGEQEFEVDAEGNQVLDEITGEPKLKQAQTTAEASFKDVYAALKESNPAAAESYRKAHFAYQSYAKAFPTPKEAMEAKQIFEDLGGTEGITSLQNEVQQYAAELTMFSNADPKLLDDLAADNPEAFGRFGTPYLERLGKMNPEAFQSTLLPYINSSLSSNVNPGLIEAGDLVYEALQAMQAAGQTTGSVQLQRAFQSLKKIYEYTQKVEQGAQVSGDRPLTDKEKQLSTREQQLNQREQERFVNEASSAVMTRMNASISKQLDPYLKTKKLSLDQKKDLAEGIYSYISQQLKSNKRYQTQLKGLMNGGDTQKVANFVGQNVDRIVVQSVKAVWNRRGFGAATTSKTGTTTAGTMAVGRAPKYEDIDWSADPGEIRYMKGEATLKGSKRIVKWDWAKVQ